MNFKLDKLSGFEKLLLIFNIASVLLILSISLFPQTILRLLLGLPFLLFIPGYTLLAALFPVKSRPDTMERNLLSFGVSIALSILVGVILNYSPWGIDLYPVLIGISLLILISSIIGWQRQLKLSPEDKINFTCNCSPASWNRQRRSEKLLQTALVVALLVAIGALAYVIRFPKETDRSSEFYILNSEGNAESYPSEVTLGESVTLTVGVINYEESDTGYRVEILSEGTELADIPVPLLEREEKWLELVSFTPSTPGNEEKIEFWLYRGTDDEPYFAEPLYLHLDVKSP